MKKFLFALLLISPLSLIFVAGCDVSPFPVEMVEGVVTLDGKPLEGVTVSFSPEPNSSGKPAVGRTGADGKFVLTAAQGGKYGQGTMKGKYRVSMVKKQLKREPTQQELAALDQGRPLNIPVVSVLPAKYTDSKTSDLAVEVVKGKNRFDFELKSN